MEKMKDTIIEISSDKHDPYDSIDDINEWDTMDDAIFDSELRYCPFNFKPICMGSSYGYFECPKNPEECQYNINDENFMEGM